MAEHAIRIGMPYVNNRWLGGMLTNFTTIRAGSCACASCARWRSPARWTACSKKEAIRLRHEREKLERNLGGIQNLERVPDAIFVIDTKKEHIAVTEARKLGIPVIAIVDTNCDPDEVDYVIPGNDDAIRAVSLVARVIADALAEGYGMAKEEIVQRVTAPAPGGRASAGGAGRRGRDALARGGCGDRRDHGLRARRPRVVGSELEIEPEPEVPAVPAEPEAQSEPEAVVDGVAEAGTLAPPEEEG